MISVSSSCFVVPDKGKKSQIINLIPYILFSAIILIIDPIYFVIILVDWIENLVSIFVYDCNIFSLLNKITIHMAISSEINMTFLCIQFS